MKSIGFKSQNIKQIFYIEILLLLFLITSLAYVMSLLIIPQANHFIANLGISLESQFSLINYGLILMTGFLVVVIFVSQPSHPLNRLKRQVYLETFFSSLVFNLEQKILF